MTLLVDILKKIVKKTLSFLGIGVYRLSSTPKKLPTAQGLVILSPIHHNTKERLDEYYSSPEVVDAYLSTERQKFYVDVAHFLVEMGIKYDGKMIADVGCGTGHLLRHIHDTFKPLLLTGFEYSKAAIEICRSTVPDAEFEYLDIYEDVNRKFDIVFCIEVMEHLLLPKKALGHLMDMVEVGGVLMITVPDGRKDTFEGHIHFWSPESWNVFIIDVSECRGFKVHTGTLKPHGTNYAVLEAEEKHD